MRSAWACGIRGSSLPAEESSDSADVFEGFMDLAGLAHWLCHRATGTAFAMNKLRTPFNTSGVAQAAALAALDDQEHVTRCIETNAAERETFKRD